jgi:hypothetical protein
MLREFDEVRVVRLAKPERPFDGTPGFLRAPAIGDIAIIVHEYDPADPAAPLAVESVDAFGNTVWLADFQRSELELLSRPSIEALKV